MKGKITANMKQVAKGGRKRTTYHKRTSKNLIIKKNWSSYRHECNIFAILLFFGFTYDVHLSYFSDVYIKNLKLRLWDVLFILYICSQPWSFLYCIT
jgi:hypothetical protein